MKTFLYYCCFVLSIFIISCGSDENKGCTDPESINFDSSATEEDGSCEYDRDKFLGNWSGPYTCEGISSPVTIKIIESNIDTKSVVLEILNSGLPSFEGIVNGNILNVSVTLNLNFSAGTCAGGQVDGQYEIFAIFTINGNKLDVTNYSEELLPDAHFDGCKRNFCITELEKD